MSSRASKRALKEKVHWLGEEAASLARRVAKAERGETVGLEALGSLVSGHGARLRALSDRVAALEAERETSGRCPKTLEAFKQMTYKPRTSAGGASDEELWEIWSNTQEEGTIEHFRALYDHGYQQGLAAGRAEQQAATEESSAAQSDPAMAAMELPRDWYPDFADWLKRQMPQNTVIGDPLWWASCIADWLMAKAALGPEREPEPSPSPAADGGLVEVIAEIIKNEPILGRPPEEEWRPEARAVIRAVAKWLRSMGNFSAATNLEREVGR